MNIDLTLYDLLEVSPHASAQVIRAAYRCLTQSTHPDKNPDSAAACERQAQINHAYSVLSDPGQRQRYDQATGPQVSAGERRGVQPGAYARTKSKSKDSGAPASRAFAFRPLA